MKCALVCHIHSLLPNILNSGALTVAGQEPHIFPGAGGDMNRAYFFGCQKICDNMFIYAKKKSSNADVVTKVIFSTLSTFHL